VVIPRATTWVRPPISRPVDHHRRQAHVLEPARHQFLERRGGALDEGARDRRLGGRLLLFFHLRADRLVGAPVAAAADSGQDPLEDEVGERVAVREVLVGGKRDLPLAARRAHARALDRHAAAAEGDRAPLGRPVGRGAVGVALALRPADFLHLGGHQLVHHAQADADRERQQALLGRPGEIAEGGLRGIGQLLLRRLLGRGDLRCGYFLHCGSSCPHSDLVWSPRTLQRKRTRREGPPSKFNGKWDYLGPQ
jgi:hypothetical protein